MGYTHYWYRLPAVPATDRFAAFADDCRRLCDALPIPLGDGEGNGRPVFGRDGVIFNGHVDSGGMMPQVARVDGLAWPAPKAEGVAGWSTTDTAVGMWFAGPLLSTRALPESGDGSYEGFSVTLEPREFDCCKTNFRPYDMVVQCCLIALKEHFGPSVAIRSDGDADAWKEPADVCQHVLGYGLTFELDGEEAVAAIRGAWVARQAEEAEAEKARKFGDYPPVPRDRAEVIRRIRDGLKRRTGRTWSVTGGRGTAWSWLRIDAPPARRNWHWVGPRDGAPRDYVEQHVPGREFGHMGPDDRAALAKALGFADDRQVHHQGEQVMPTAWTEYVDRAEGREPREYGRQTWD